MAADDSESIAEQIDDDPSLVGVTAAEDRDDETGGDAGGQTENPTWGDVWAFYEESVDYDFPPVVSKTQLGTMLAGHPDVGVRDTGDAKTMIDDAEGGAIVETGPNTTKYTLREGHDAEI